MTDIDVLIQAVDRADSSIKLLEAVEKLADVQSEKGIPTLIAALGYNNPGAAVAAVDGLIRIGEPAVKGLLNQLDSHNYTARSWAIRALAGIGDPRGLITLLGAATADFSMSVRRAAAKGLGTMKWHWFPDDLLEIAQYEALDALLFVVEQDEEWVVRYSAVVGLQSLGITFDQPTSEIKGVWRCQIERQLTQLLSTDPSLTVRARTENALQQLRSQSPNPPLLSVPSSLSTMDWHLILEKLYERKGIERQAIAEGDPRKYRQLAVTIYHRPHPNLEN
ncbi:MAG: HEAT repeat domain-containing protein [Cyanobacteria bacterium LVE1205-1]|jgi:phycocyanobilin lyase beta subunit